MRIAKQVIYMLLVLCWLKADASAQEQTAQGSSALHTIVVIEEPGVSCARDVPEEQRAQARKLLKEGNALFYDGLFSAALGKYRQAIDTWDCPPFHYNAAMAQLQLDQHVEAYYSLSTALERGESGLDQLYEHAVKERERLLKRLGEIEVVSKDEGAQVALDGKPLFVAPGSTRVVVQPGGHQLVATRPGRLPDTQQIVVNRGESKRFALATALPPTLRFERRWAEWKPWAALGTGAALIISGIYFQGSASAGFDRFDDIVGRECQEAGCSKSDIPESATEVLDQARAQQWIARIVYGVGGAVMVTGTALVYFNRERRVLHTGERLSLTPLVIPGAAHVRITLEF